MTITTPNKESFVKAVAFAMEAHDGDLRKGTTIPYVSHLLQVAGLIWEFGGNDTEAIGGLLHDAAEDAGGEPMIREIERNFGPVVAGIVRENSDSITESKEVKAPWRERKEAYVAAIDHKSESACLVSLCDKIHNARTLITDSRIMGEDHWKRFNASKSDSQWYYRALVTAFEERAETFPRLRSAVSEFGQAVNVLFPNA